MLETELRKNKLCEQNKPATMPKIIKFMKDNTRGILRKERSDEIALTSPRSLEDAEELFQPNRNSVFKFDAISAAPIDTNGDLRPHEEDMELTEPPTEKDYDFDYDDYYRQTNSQPVAVENKPSILRQRSRSVQRPLQGNGHRRRATSTRPSRTRRSVSVGRTEQFRGASQRTKSSTRDMQDSGLSAVDLHDSGLSGGKKRKSKMEKIIQLQEKNQRYKDEFRKVQKDRKGLKKDIEIKKLAIAALTKEVDSQTVESRVLKEKLSEALQQLDKTGVSERKDRDSISRLKSDLSEAKRNYQSAVAQMDRMRDEIEALNVASGRKDDQIEALALEVAEQQDALVSLQAELHESQRVVGSDKASSEELREKREENRKLKDELSTTLQHASTMVKEREDAISELLRENEEMKKRMVDSTGDRDEIDEEVLALRAELDETAKSLEHSQDRTVALEEEVEAWMSKSQENDAELVRLRLENEDCQQRRLTAENALAIAETTVSDSAKKVAELEADLVETEKRHQAFVDDIEQKHTEALLDQKEKVQKLMAETEKEANSNPQEMMLSKAVADRKAKEGNASWGLMQRVRGEGKDAVSPEVQRIKELEALLATQEEELMQTKSDMVRMKTSYNDTLYKNKKHIEDLEKENQKFVEQFGSLPLDEAKFPDLLPNA